MLLVDLSATPFSPIRLVKSNGKSDGGRVCWSMTTFLLSRQVTSFLTAFGALGIPILFGALLWEALPHFTFTYDEADYAYAASKGIAANYTDSPAISLADFVALGLANRDARTNVETQGKAGESLSEYIRRNGDITFYRHFHPPLYFYGLSIAGKLSGFDEQALRLVSALAVALAAGIAGYVAFRLMLQMSPQIGPAMAAGAVALFFSASSPILIETGMTVTPHSLFSALAVATLGATAIFLGGGKRRWWRAAAVLLGFAFLTIEYAPVLAGAVLLATVIAWRGWQQETRRQCMQLMLETGCIAVLVIFLLWPSGLVKLSMIKNYVVFAYFALVRASSAYGTTSLIAIWAERVTHSPQLLLAIVTLPFLAWQTMRGGEITSLLPFFLYIVLLLFINIQNHSPNPTYASSLIPALGVCFGIAAGMFTNWHIRIGGSLVAVLVVFMLVTTSLFSWPPNISAWVPISKGQDQLVAVLRNSLGASLDDKACLSVPSVLLPTLHYYVPSLVLKPYDPNATSGDYCGRCDYALVITSQEYDERLVNLHTMQELLAQDSLRYVIVTHSGVERKQGGGLAGKPTVAATTQR